MTSKRDTKPPPPPTTRRKDERYGLQAPLRAKCTTWSSFHELFTLNISRTGLFVPTEHAATVGDPVKLIMHTPDGGLIHLEGVVRHVLTATASHPAGIGIQLTAAIERDQYDTLVERAAAASNLSKSAGDSHSGSLFGGTPRVTPQPTSGLPAAPAERASPLPGSASSAQTPVAGPESSEKRERRRS